MSPSQWMITGSRDLRQHAVIDLRIIVGAVLPSFASAREAIRMMRPPAFSTAETCSS